MKELFDACPPLAYCLLAAICIFIWGMIYCAIKEVGRKNDKSGSYTHPDFSGITIDSRMKLSEKPHATYDKICSIEIKSSNCTTPDSAQKCVDDLRSIQFDLEINGDPERVAPYLASAIREAEKNVSDIKMGKWEEKAWDVLSKFRDEFSFVTSGDSRDFRHIEDVLKSSKKCMDLWHKYWSIPLDSITVQVDPHEYMEKYLGEDFEPCMHSSLELRKRLDKATEQLKPEHKRKLKLYSEIIDYVRANDNIMRCELLKHPFRNATDKEVKCCYNDLIKKYRLVEIKIGNRYFVSLSDKEKEKLVRH